MLNGFRPTAQEDKWFIYADGPDADGHAVLHMHWSWAGDATVDLAIELSRHEDLEEEIMAEIKGITWDTVGETTEAYAKYVALEGCIWVLGIKLMDKIDEPVEWESLPLKRPGIKANQTLFRRA